MKRIYLDHAAATPVASGVLAAMLPYFAEEFANPSAIHKEGVMARSAVENARNDMASVLHVLPDELTFTGGATESVNLAIVGAVSSWKNTHSSATPHVIISAIEHDAVFAAVRTLESVGARVSILPVDANGIVKVDELAAMITEQTVLVAVMYANNEIGTIEPLNEIAKVIRKWKKDVRGTVRSKKSEGDDLYPLFYTDASQAPNYLDCAPASLGVDMMTISGGKMYGPKGAGLLYVARGVALSPIVFGGGQEKGLRAGTENVSSIIGMKEALSMSVQIRVDEVKRLSEIQKATMALLLETFPNILLNGSLVDRLPNNIHFSFPDVDHEYLALALDARGFAVATKSACSETEAEISHVLLALRSKGDERPKSGIRVTMGRSTRMEDMSEFVATLLVIMNTMMGTK